MKNVQRFEELSQRIYSGKFKTDTSFGRLIQEAGLPMLGVHSKLLKTKILDVW